MDDKATVLNDLVKQFCKAFQLDEEDHPAGFDISGGMIGLHVSAFLRQVAARIAE